MGLKKFVKKIKKGVKKVLKSPIGKIAVPAAAMFYGGPALAGALGGGAAGATGAGALIGAGSGLLTGTNPMTGAMLGGAAGYGANRWGLLGGAPTEGGGNWGQSWGTGDGGSFDGGFVDRLTSGPLPAAIAGGLLGGSPVADQKADDKTNYGPPVNYGFMSTPNWQDPYAQQKMYGKFGKIKSMMGPDEMPQEEGVNPYMPSMALNRRGEENSGAWRFMGGVPYGAA
jgi:hypothetical protein